MRNKAAVKYAATKLQEKGVLLVNIQSIHPSNLHISCIKLPNHLRALEIYLLTS